MAKQGGGQPEQKPTLKRANGARINVDDLGDIHLIFLGDDLQPMSELVFSLDMSSTMLCHLMVAQEFSAAGRTYADTIH